MQAERKASPSTLTPDMDNAIVGSRDTVDYTEISIGGISVYYLGKEVFRKRNSLKLLDRMSISRGSQ